jgi:hypothetical protein
MSYLGQVCLGFDDVSAKFWDFYEEFLDREGLLVDETEWTDSQSVVIHGESEHEYPFIQRYFSDD